MADRTADAGYFLGADRLKFEVVHIPAEKAYTEVMRALERGTPR